MVRFLKVKRQTVFAGLVRCFSSPVCPMRAKHVGLEAKCGSKFFNLDSVWPARSYFPREFWEWAMLKTVSAFAIFCLAILWFSPGMAEGALAIGMPGADPSQGFRHSKIVNDANAASEAMKDCRAARNPKTGAACKLIGTFHDQCATVAVNGDVVNEYKPIIAAGWAIAPDSTAAISRAIAQCEAMRKGRRGECQIEGKTLCDGSAK